LPCLKYYAQEQRLFSTEFATKLNDEEAEYVFERLKGHYHFSQWLEIGGRKCSGRCNAWMIRVSHEPSVALIAHEVAHAIHKRKFGEKFHTKRHTRIMQRVCEYMMRRLPEWREFLQRNETEYEARSQARLLRLQETARYKNSIPGRLERLRGREKRWTRRRKLADTMLRKIRRKIKCLERRQERTQETALTTLGAGDTHVQQVDVGPESESCSAFLVTAANGSFESSTCSLQKSKTFGV
jgi:hypothetical protein